MNIVNEEGQVKGYPLYTAEGIRDFKESTDTSVNRYADKHASQFMTDKTHFGSITYTRFGVCFFTLSHAPADTGAGGARIALSEENSCFRILSYYAIVDTNTTNVPPDKERPEKTRSLFQQSAIRFFHSYIQGRDKSIAPHKQFRV